MIFELGSTLISDEIFTKNFVCHLEKCQGACCVEGDRGAPLSREEVQIIEKELESILPYMTKEGRELLHDEGFHEGLEIDDAATTCLPGGECVFSYRENGILGCAIEKAYKEGATDFYKPISCHLYPIRMGKVGDMDTINYHQWDICKAACSLGNELNVPLFRFLKTALIRKYGEPWFNELEEVYDAFKKQFPS